MLIKEKLEALSSERGEANRIELGLPGVSVRKIKPNPAAKFYQKFESQDPKKKEPKENSDGSTGVD
jgi:hypothetical protein